MTIGFRPTDISKGKPQQGGCHLLMEEVWPPLAPDQFAFVVS